MKKSSSNNGLIFWPGLLLPLLLVALYLARSKTKNLQSEVITTNKDAKFLFSELLLNGFDIKQSRFILAQAGHETGGFKSKIYLENNNCFGMKLARVRETTAQGERYGHAYYKTVSDSVKDFTIYYRIFKYRTVYLTIADYVKALKKNGYFEANETAYLLGCIYFYDLYFKTS